MKTTINFWNLRNMSIDNKDRWRTSREYLKELAYEGIIAEIGRFSEVIAQFERNFYERHKGDGEVPFTEGWDWDEQLTQLYLDLLSEFNNLNESEEYDYFEDYVKDRLEATQADLDAGRTVFCSCCGAIVEKEHSVNIDGGHYCYDCALDEIRDKIKDRDADND